MARSRVPLATYRLQLNSGFRFADARATVPYLSRLGITDVYASPILKARRGSTHGYDVTCPLSLNPELGTGQDFKALTRGLHRRHMGLLLDIVPNHMAADMDNPWWMDVLESGQGSPYARYFDIDWRPAAGAAGKVVLPILDGPLDSVLERQGLQLTLDEGGFAARYNEWRLPLAPMSYLVILEHDLEGTTERLGTGHPALEGLVRLIGAVRRLPAHPAGRQVEAIKAQLWHLYQSHPEAKGHIDDSIGAFNDQRGSAGSPGLLRQLLAAQAYLLEHWKAASEVLNYRRFFTISDLVGLRVEEPAVFEAWHGLVLQMIAQGEVTGLRIDHIDGMYDPTGYLVQLQGRIPPRAGMGRPPGFYTVVEKVVMGDETLPQEWPVCGTTGYDFLNAVNQVFVDPDGLARLEAGYARFAGPTPRFADIVYRQKRRALEELLGAETRALWGCLCDIAAQDHQAKDISPAGLAQALVEVTACVPVYRTYTRSAEVSHRDRLYIERAVDEAEERGHTTGAAPFELLRRVLLLDLPPHLAAGQREEWLRFVMRWQQLTGPAMAKGLEDSALYLYNPLVSLNEVGGGIQPMADPVGAFHRHNQACRERWPHTLNATSTHDTKRGEDCRARINVLSEVPVAWSRRLWRWHGLNRDSGQTVDGHRVPTPSEEVLLYQTLLGAWPLSEEGLKGFGERLKAYMVKAAREAGAHTTWTDPDGAHEQALEGFVDALLEGEAFREDFLRFQRRVAYFGMLNSLAQALLKIASPGTPDLYQGTELWDLSLVDPDNRRPVDFAARTRLLDGLERRAADSLPSLCRDILGHWEDGRVKLYLVSRALTFRRAHAELFLEGEYIPVYARGAMAPHIVAFARCRGEEWVLVAVPRLTAGLYPRPRPPLGKVWGESVLQFPQGAPHRWANRFTGERLEASPSAQGAVLGLSEVFRRFPVALLCAEED